MVRFIRTAAPSLAAIIASLCAGAVQADSPVVARGQQPTEQALTGAWDRYGATASDPRVTAAPWCRRHLSNQPTKPNGWHSSRQPRRLMPADSPCTVVTPSAFLMACRR